MGIPAMASRNAPADTMILIDPDQVAFGTGGVETRVSKQATVEMATNPAQHSVGTFPEDVVGPDFETVSLFQANATGILTEVLVNWTAAPGAVSALITTGSAA